MKTLLFGCLVALLVASCAAEDTGRVVVAFDVSGLTGPQAGGDDLMTDEAGMAHLDRFPAYLVLRVEGEDLDEPVTASWPEEIPSEEELEGDVALEVEVPAGEGREVFLDLLWAEGGEVSTYVVPEPGAAPPTVAIAGGGEEELILAPVELPRGTVVAELGSSHEVISFAWVDDQTFAALPSVDPTGEEEIVSQLAVGRTYWPLVELADGSRPDLSRQTVNLDSEGELLEITLDL